MTTPFAHSTWALRDLLTAIEFRQSEHLLKNFLDRLHTQLHGDQLLHEVMGWLQERDEDTGILRMPWAYQASLHARTVAITGKMDPLLPYTAVEAERPQPIMCTLLGGEVRPFYLVRPSVTHAVPSDVVWEDEPKTWTDPWVFREELEAERILLVDTVAGLGFRVF